MKHHLLITLLTLPLVLPAGYAQAQADCKQKVDDQRSLINQLNKENEQLYHYAKQLEEMVWKCNVPPPPRPAVIENRDRADAVSGRPPVLSNPTNARPLRPGQVAGGAPPRPNTNVGVSPSPASSPRPNTSVAKPVVDSRNEDIIKVYQGEVEDRMLNPGNRPSYFGKELNVFGNNFKTYVVDLQDPKVGIDLFYRDNTTRQMYHDLHGMERAINQAGDGRTMIFGTNAGIFNNRNQPLGLYIENQIEHRRLIPSTAQGRGNFYLHPNGVFFVDATGKPGVMKTGQYESRMAGRPVNMATQSGPMLVIDGHFNPQFNPGSRNLNIRSGVGVVDDRYLVFAISSRPVNFYDFARIFRDVYDCNNALYLDGAISKVMAPREGWTYRQDQVASFAAMIGVYTK